MKILTNIYPFLYLLNCAEYLSKSAHLGRWKAFLFGFGALFFIPSAIRNGYKVVMHGTLSNSSPLFVIGGLMLITGVLMSKPPWLAAVKTHYSKYVKWYEFVMIACLATALYAIFIQIDQQHMRSL